jgi:uncharacterized membrane protein
VLWIFGCNVLFVVLLCWLSCKFCLLDVQQTYGLVFPVGTVLPVLTGVLVFLLSLVYKVLSSTKKKKKKKVADNLVHRDFFFFFFT